MKEELEHRIEQLEKDIAGYKLTEKALIHSEAMYRSLVETTNTGYLIIDTEGKVIDANREYVMLSGHKELSEIVGRKVIEWTAEYEKQKNIEAIRQCIESGNIKNFVVDYVDKNGNITPVEINATIQDMDGCLRIISLCHNISERKQMEKLLKKSEEKHRLLIKNSHDIIYTMTTGGMFNFVSPAWTTLLGHSVEQVEGRPFQQFVHKDDIAACMVWLQKVITTGQRQEGIEYRVQHINGTWYWHTSSAVPLLNEANMVVGFEGIARDITERKIAEEALSKSEGHLREVLENSLSVFYKRNLQTKDYDYLSPVCCKMTGYGMDEIKPFLTEYFKNFVHPDDWPEIERIISKSMVDTTSTTYQMGYRFKHKDGRYRWCQDQFVVIRNTDGQPTAIIGNVSDITEHKQTEEALIESKKILNKSLLELQSKNEDLITINDVLKNLKEKYETINNQLKLEVARANAMTMAADQASVAKNTFLANIGHELRSPLNDIVGFSEILLNKNDISPENQKSYIEIVYKRTQDLLILVNDLLDISKIEAGKLSLSYETIKFKRLINEVGNSFAKEIQNKNIKYNVSIEKNVPKYLVTDPFRLKQILINLIGNAIKFTDSGEINLYIVKVINKDLDPINKVELEICISDTGIGIPKHNQSELFKPFSQVQDTSQKQYGGTGLGLAISRRLVEMMDGKISMQDNTPKGSRFCFTIIANKVTEKHTYPIIDDDFLKNKVNEILNKRTITLLIVEDQTTSMDILRVNITKKSEKIKLILVADGQEAMAVYSQGKVDAMLTDIVMPNMDGFALIQQIRYVENKTNKHTPIIAMTASASERDKEKCLNAGADFYITKPIYKSDLYKILDIMIEKHFG